MAGTGSAVFQLYGYWQGACRFGCVEWEGWGAGTKCLLTGQGLVQSGRD